MELTAAVIWLTVHASCYTRWGYSSRPDDQGTGGSPEDFRRARSDSGLGLRFGHVQPQLVIGGMVLSNGEDWTSNGPEAGIAYLQTRQCLLNGEHCTLLEFNLNNPACAGCGSSVDISLIDSHALNVPIAFSYFNGCDGQGATCTTSDCRTAFHRSDDNQVQVACQVDNVDLLITFCPDGSSDQIPPATAPQVPASSEPILPAPATTPSVSPSFTASLISYVPVRSSDVPSPSKPGVVSVSGSPVPAPQAASVWYWSRCSPALTAGAGKTSGKT